VGGCADIALRPSIQFDRAFDDRGRSVSFTAGAIFAAVLSPVESVAEISVRFLPSRGKAAAFPCVEAARRIESAAAYMPKMRRRNDHGGGILNLS
jgi:hypothetical protein